MKDLSSQDSGWIKIHRKILNWQWSASSSHVSLFIHLLLRANYKETKWRKEVIKPGELLTGRKQLALWVGISESSVFRILNDLEITGELNIKKTNKYSIITINKWSDYQLFEQQVIQPMNNKRTTGEQQANTSKNIKKEKKNIVYDYFTEKYKAKYNTPYISTRTDFVLLANLKKNIGDSADDVICLKIDAYFIKDYWFTKDQLRTIGSFIQHFNKIEVLQVKQEGEYVRAEY